jgi:hypothetical protein
MAIPEFGTAMPEPTLSRILDDILGWKSPALIRPEFQFFWTKQAAEHNLSILESYNMDLDSALQSQPFGALTFGSEFCPINMLAPLFGRHPLWHRVRWYLTEGTSPPVTPIAEKDRLHDLGQMLKYGNHKSAEKEQERLVGMLREEVQWMWQLPLPRRAIVHILDNNKFGKIVAKWRLTHDQTYEPTPGEYRSVNHHTRFEELTPCCYGRALTHHIYNIINMRAWHPTKRILQTKANWKSAYRRLHQSGQASSGSATYINGILLLALHVTFGGAANPSQWSDVAEMSFDMSNDLIRNEGWDPS